MPGSEPIPPASFVLLVWEGITYHVSRAEYERAGLVRIDDVLVRGVLIGDVIETPVEVVPAVATKA